MNIYTDGACKDNYRQEGVAEGVGGWAYVILEEIPGKENKVIKKESGYKNGTTNQEMEIIAVTKAFESIINLERRNINLYSDSAYVINCLKDKWFDKWKVNGWLNSKGKPVVNKELWERLLIAIEKHDVNFFHVKRNSTKYIRIVDGLAKQSSKIDTTQE